MVTFLYLFIIQDPKYAIGKYAKVRSTKSNQSGAGSLNTIMNPPIKKANPIVIASIN
jgi:hypothetical protein